MRLPMLACVGLCILSLVTIWAGAGYIVGEDFRRSGETAAHDSANLARAFEEHIVRSLQAFDQTLLLARDAYLHSGADFDLPRWVVESKFRTDVALNISIADARGMLIASIVNNALVPIDISDREHFRVHVNGRRDELYISQPLTGRATGQTSLLLTRRISDPTGAFTGVILLSVDPTYFTSFYQSVDIGRRGSVQLIGTDGVVRARVSGTDRRSGHDLKASSLFRHLAVKPVGSFVTEGYTDGVQRIASYRQIPGYPMVVVVGFSIDDVFASARTNRAIAILGAGVLSLLMLASALVVLRGQHRLNESEFKFRSMFDVAPVGIALVGPSGNVIETNRAFLRIADRSAADVATQRIDDMLVGNGLGGFVASRASTNGNESQTEPTECRVERADGSTATVLCNATPASASEAALTWLTVQDISERKRTEMRIWEAAHVDLLTGLPNRKRLCDDIDEILAGRKGATKSVALFLLDLDNFKAINDTLGHEAGDFVLRKVAHRAGQIRAGNDLVARYGGDEFAIIVRNFGDLDNLMRIARRVLRTLRRRIDYRGHAIEIRASVGAAMSPQHGTTRTELFRSADLALYAAKRLGRDRAVVYESAMLADAERQYNVISDFRAAAAAGRVGVHYQPVVSLTTGAVVGFEALARITGTDGRLQSPTQFGAVLDDAESCRELGRQVFNRVINDLQAWRAAGLDVGRIAVNASSFELALDNYADRIVKALAARDIPCECFEIEVTETAMIDDAVPAVARNLGLLACRGIAIALDDFGTGYASLRHIKSLPISRVKIDRSFVVNITSDIESRAIVEAVVRLSHSLGKTVVAEGMEHAEQLDELTALGCDAAQGFAIARPMPPDQVPVFLLTNVAAQRLSPPRQARKIAVSGA